MINKMARWITKHPKIVLLVALILIVPSAIGFFCTRVNYDILSYLPENLDSVQGINSLDDDFGEASMAIIVMKDMTWNEMENVENDIGQLENVSNVLWLGSVLDSPMPVEMLPDEISSLVYNADKDSTLMLVQFKMPGASEETLNTIGQIKTVLTKNCLMSGTSALTYELEKLTNSEAPIYIAFAIALALVALMFTMDSFVLPFVLLAALGIAVIYNMGTNFMFGQISFITQAIAAILQLGVTMDYSVFLMDRYTEEKPKYKTREAAMAKAITSTFTSLAGSSLTTIFGFLALCFMSLTLGLDIGLVMAKGVLLGILCVVIVLPAMLLLCEKVINKTHHKSLVPSFHGLDKITIKFRKVFAIIFVILIIPCWYGQNHVQKYYNMMQAVPDSMESIQALNTLKDEFNMASTYFVVFDDSLTSDSKLDMISDLQQIDGISSAFGINSVVGTAFPTSVIPDSVKSMFATEGKQLLMVNSIYSPATDEANIQVDQINSLIKSYDSSAKLTGEAPMYKDLIEVADHDFLVTSVLSIAAIFVLIAIIFKSISIPFILVLSIEFAIWMNMSISFISGDVICFLTPTVISCVQLGATVDYAILLTTRFREEIRHGLEKKAAMHKAADSALKSIFQSALVFFAATFGVYLICDIDIVRSICSMLARGAIISALVIMLFLAPVLVVCEGLINKTTYRWREDKRPVQFTSPMIERMQKNMEKAEKRMKKRISAATGSNGKIAGQSKPSKAVPVPAELVTAHLTDESAAEIEKAMETPPEAVKEEIDFDAKDNAAKNLTDDNNSNGNEENK